MREICLPRSTAAPIVTGSAALSVPRMVHAWWSVRPARGSCMVVRRVHGALVVGAVHIFLTGPSAPSRAACRLLGAVHIFAPLRAARRLARVRACGMWGACAKKIVRVRTARIFLKSFHLCVKPDTRTDGRRTLFSFA